MAIKLHANETLIYYNPACNRARKLIAYARSTRNKINEVEWPKTSFTTTYWRQLLDMLKLQPKELLDKSLVYYQQNIRGRVFDDEAWLYVLMKNPHLIKGPIVVKGNKAMLCTNPSDFFKL